jgi:hypothetical protein
MESWKEIVFWTIYLHDDGGPLTPNEPKLLKQVQNFYFLRIAQVFYGDESAL